MSNVSLPWNMAGKSAKLKIGMYICKLFTDVRLSSCVSVARLYMLAAAALASVPLLSVI